MIMSHLTTMQSDHLSRAWELTDMYNLSTEQLSARLNIGWTLERALKTPLYGDR